VFANPVAQGLQVARLVPAKWCRLLGADVEQQVATHADHFAEHAHDLAHRFVIVIVHLIAPRVVHGDAKLPRAFRLRDGNALLGVL
jgi:hypothetical protein